MNLAVHAAEIVQELSELPSNHPSYIKKTHKPDSQHIHQFKPTPIQVHRSDQAVPMDIDAIELGSSKKKNSIFLQIMKECQDRKICARCLKNYDLQGTHAKGVCPNQNKSLQEKLKFLNIKSVSQINVEDQQKEVVNHQTEEFNVNSIAFVNTTEEQSLAENELISDYFLDMNEMMFPNEVQQQ